MPSFNIVKKSKPSESFRVASVMGKFDLNSNKIEETFVGNIELPKKWQVGLIVGASGTGKTTIAKELFPKSYITNFKYKAESILDDMPKDKSIDEIVKTFNAVGFSSPPSWLKSYSVLSNGQKMRVDLANALLNNNKLIVFDEFTSVVDRKIAQIGSYAVQKSVRRTKKQFIAVSCHFDVEDWLMPDWIFNTDTMTFLNLEKQKKNRPKVDLQILATKDKTIWKAFAKHHYLSHTHHNAAHTYVAYVNNQLAGFISILHFPHQRLKNMKKVHRLVILPDFQGIGFGIILLEFIGKYYIENNYRFSITTSAPSLIHFFKKSNDWRLKSHGRTMGGRTKSANNKLNSGSEKRLTTNWEFII